MARKKTPLTKSKSPKKTPKRQSATAKAAPKNAAKRQMFLVLGMHRSGTSTLSGLLHNLGCRLPETLMAATERNPKGYFESLPVSEFNEQLLKKTGSGWKSLQTMSPDWIGSAEGRTMQGQAKELLEQEFGTDPLVVFKDPRICRMVPFWTAAAQACGFEVRPILIHRNPLEVAKSLVERDGIETTEGFMIWLQHVLMAEYATRKTDRVITSYDQILSDWKAQVAGIETKFGLKFPKTGASVTRKINGFLSPGLRHFQEAPEQITDNEDVAQWVRTTYTIFEQWAQEGETKSSYAALDRVRLEMSRAMPVFLTMIEARTHRLSTDLHKRVAQVRTAHARRHEDLKKIATLETRLDRYAIENAQFETDIKEHKSLSSKLRREIDDISQILVKRQEQLGKSHETQADLRSRIGTLQSELEVAIQAQSQQLTAFENDKANTTEELSAQITQKEAEVAHLSQSLDSTVAETERLSSALAEREERLETTEESLRKLDNEKMALLEDISDVTARYDALQKQADQNDRTRAEAEAKLKALEDQLASTQSALAQRQLEAEETFERAAAAEQAHTEAQAEIAQLSSVVADKNDQLEAYGKKFMMQAAEKAVFLSEVSDITARRDALQTLADQKNQAHAASQEEVKSLQDALARSQGILAQRELEIKETVENLRAAEQARKEAEASRQSLSGQLSAKAQTVQALSDSEAALTAKVQTLDTALAGKTQMAQALSDSEAALTAKVQTLDSALADTTQKAQAMTAKVQTLEGALAQKTDMAQTLSASEAAKAAKIQSLEATLAEKIRVHKGEHQKTTALTQEQQNRITELQVRLDAISNSRFWRLTGPLRKAVDTLRGVR